MTPVKNTSSKLKGIARLMTDASVGLIDVVEAMHKRVVHPPFLPSTPIQHLITNVAGIAYENLRWSTKLVGGGIEDLIGKTSSWIGEIQNSPNKEALQAALNGVVGDYLVAHHNPLQIDMQFRYLGQTVSFGNENLMESYPNINGKILVLVHGSSMNDLQWERNDHDHGRALAKELNLTPIYLHYNTGLHISTNGQQFNQKLEELVAQWSVPVEEIVILSHSMGGLVSRSAIHYGMQEKNIWATRLKKIVFLGTPHHGAPLERIGNYLDAILETVPYTKPLARLGKIRSAGITDLRYGNLIDEDWQNKDRFKINGDDREIIALPNHVTPYCIAAAMGKSTSPRKSKIIGDRLVDVKSALGKHKNSAKDLGVKKKHTLIAYEHSHLDLLNSDLVYQKIKGWVDS